MKVIEIEIMITKVMIVMSDNDNNESDDNESYNESYNDNEN